MTPTDMLTAAIRRNPLRSQREACNVTARRSIAAFGPVQDDAAIRSYCVALASGLFGDAYDDDPAAQDRAIALMEEEYRKCIGSPAFPRPSSRTPDGAKP
jgi:hypothetical protein